MIERRNWFENWRRISIAAGTIGSLAVGAWAVDLVKGAHAEMGTQHFMIASYECPENAKLEITHFDYASDQFAPASQVGDVTVTVACLDDSGSQPPLRTWQGRHSGASFVEVPVQDTYPPSNQLTQDYFYVRGAMPGLKASGVHIVAGA